jgi:hypothetical protein
MKKLIYGSLFLAIVGIGIVGCEKETIIRSNQTTYNNQELSKNEIIDGFKRSFNQFEKARLAKTSNKYEDDIVSGYKKNLEIINSNTSLELNFNVDEINAISSTLNNDFLEFGYYLSDDEIEEKILKIKEDGNYELFLEVQDILNEVYFNKDGFQQKAISWGCGLALASNFVATVGLTACVTGVGCPLAVAGKVLAVAGVAASC